VTPVGSTVYSDYIAEQVAREEERKTSLESRGVGVVTTSGALATLLLGFTTLAKKAGQHLLLPTEARGLVHLAMAFFAAAVLLAILTNVPVLLKWADPKDLRKLLADSWDDSVSVAESEVADNRLELLESLSYWNDRKGWLLLGAMTCEGIGVAFVAAAVWRV
jgi:hypothetical protein